MMTLELWRAEEPQTSVPPGGFPSESRQSITFETKTIAAKELTGKIITFIFSKDSGQ